MARQATKKRPPFGSPEWRALYMKPRKPAAGGPRPVATKPNGNPKRRRNGREYESPAELFEKFHGRQSSKEVDYIEQIGEPGAMAELGRLATLVIATPAGRFTITPDSNIRLCATTDGQLYFRGGDQSLDLKALGIAGGNKHRQVIGPVERIDYTTKKKFDGFEPVQYQHTFGEEGGELPVLIYDSLNRLIDLAGGDYKVKPEGITN